MWVGLGFLLFWFFLIKYLVQLFTWFLNAKILSSANLRAILKNSAFRQLLIGLAPCKPVNGKLDAAIKFAKVMLRVKRRLISFCIIFPFLYNLLNHIATLKLPAVLKLQSCNLNIPHGCRCHSNSTLALKNNKTILINVWFVF